MIALYLAPLIFPSTLLKKSISLPAPLFILRELFFPQQSQFFIPYNNLHVGQTSLFFSVQNIHIFAVSHTWLVGKPFTGLLVIFVQHCILLATPLRPTLWSAQLRPSFQQFFNFFSFSRVKMINALLALPIY